MNTILLYQQDAYMTETTAHVISIDSNTQAIKLDQTIIYPGGGGQPADQAKINNHQIVNILKQNDEIYYQLDSPDPSLLREGTKVTISIDWEFRYVVMKLHTVQHLFAAKMLKQYAAQLAGNAIYPGNSHVDFAIEKNFTTRECEAIETTINDIIRKNLPVSARILPFDQAKALLSPDRVRFEHVPDLPELRLVEIGTLDRISCGGTHVQNTGEIGTLTIKKFKSKGKRRKRFYYEITDLPPKTSSKAPMN
jgi:misacylated tRNA(Ala) deacylase